MPDDGVVVDAQDGRAADGFVVEAVEKRVVHLLGFHHVVDGFGHFQQHVARVAVAANHVGLVVEQVAALDIADEVNVRVFLEELKRGLQQRGALALFLAQVHEAHFGPLDAQHVLRIQRAQLAELLQHFGLALGVGPHIEQNAEAAVQLGHEVGDGRAQHAGHGLHREHGPHQHGPRVAGRAKGFYGPALQQFVAHGDARILLLLEGFGRVFAHVDDLAGGHKFEGGPGRAGGGQQRLHGIGLANEDDAGLARQEVGGQQGTRHGGLGGEVAAHCVEGYFHESKGFGRRGRGYQSRPHRRISGRSRWPR